MRHQVHRRLKSAFWLVTSFLYRPHTTRRNTDGSVVASGFPTSCPHQEHNSTVSWHGTKVSAGKCCQDLPWRDQTRLSPPKQRVSLQAPVGHCDSPNLPLIQPHCEARTWEQWDNSQHFQTLQDFREGKSFLRRRWERRRGL